MAKKLPNSPSRSIWIAALIIGGLGILGHYGIIKELYAYDYTMTLVGFGLLAIGTSFRNI